MRAGILRQPVLDHLVLCVCEAVARVNQFLKLGLKYLQIRTQYSRVTLSKSFKTFSLIDECALLFKNAEFSGISLVRPKFF